MTINGKVHCFFEQSGTFKNEFRKLGYEAYDYDIQNNFGETDHVIDLFAEIEKAYSREASIFDSISSDDLILAFFPCIYFCQQNSTFFDGTNFNWKDKTINYKSEQILLRSRERQRFYEIALKMFTYCDTGGFRLIVENPYSPLHYLNNNFPYKPSLVDKNRRLRGDWYVKPTQYWFVNCSPTLGHSFQKQSGIKTVNGLSGHAGSLCDEERSMISPDYARNFICDFIIGKCQTITQPSLFDNDNVFYCPIKSKSEL